MTQRAINFNHDANAPTLADTLLAAGWESVTHWQSRVESRENLAKLRGRGAAVKRTMRGDGTEKEFRVWCRKKGVGQ